MIIVDETLSGSRVGSFQIEGLKERLTMREVIRARIWQEVQDYNAGQQMTPFVGLVQPSWLESQLNGVRSKVRKAINWESQYEAALKAFKTNGFFILIGDKQAADLDEVFEIEPETEVSFVKLIPLVGG